MGSTVELCATAMALGVFHVPIPVTQEGLSLLTPLQDWRPPTKETMDFKKKKEKVWSAVNTRGGRICLSIPSAVLLRNTISIFTWEAVILDMSYLQHSHTWSDLPGKL